MSGRGGKLKTLAMWTIEGSYSLSIRSCSSSSDSVEELEALLGAAAAAASAGGAGAGARAGDGARRGRLGWVGRPMVLR